MTNKTTETKLMTAQVEPTPLKDEELDRVSGGARSTTTNSMYKTNPGAMACCQ